MKRLALLALILTSSAAADSLITLAYVPASVNTGDTFDLGVYLTPGPGDQVNTFSIDLIYSDFLSVDLTTTPTEDGYFLQNGFFYFGGMPVSISTPGLLELSGISDTAGFCTDPSSGCSYDPGPGPDELFDIVFTATAPGAPQVMAGPNSFLTDPFLDNINFSATTEPTPSPEPSAGLFGAVVLGILAALARRRNLA